jgi:hypothetical protein
VVDEVGEGEASRVEGDADLLGGFAGRSLGGVFLVFEVPAGDLPLAVGVYLDRLGWRQACS